MSQLQTHDASELIIKGKHPRLVPVPGDMVRHRDDKASLGLCVSRRADETNRDLKSGQPCVILWSKQPAPTYTAQGPIKAPPSNRLSDADIHHLVLLGKSLEEIRDLDPTIRELTFEQRKSGSIKVTAVRWQNTTVPVDFWIEDPNGQTRPR